MRTRTILCLFGLLLVTPLWALDSRLQTSQYQVQCYGVAHGLPQGSVHSIVQHPSGYLLLGTNRGLSRFDGARISPLEFDGQPVLTETQVHKLQLAADGGGEAAALWVSAFDGLYRLDSEGLRRWSVADGLPQNRITAVLVEPDGIWVGTQGGVVFLPDGVELPQGAVPVGTMRVNSFDRDPDGTLWLAATDGLYRQRPGEPIELISQGIFWSTLRDSSGRRWFGGRQRSYSLDPGPGQRLVAIAESDGMPALPVRQILQDRDGQIWFANAGAGLYRYKGGRYERVPGLGSDVVYSVAQDAEGNLWAGTSSGFCSIRDGAILGYGRTEGLGTDFILSMAADAHNRIYVGSNGRGLFRIDQAEVEYLGNPGGSPFVNWLGVLDDGQLLVSSNAGTFRWNDGQSQPLHPDLPPSGAGWVASDSEGVLWLRSGAAQLQRIRDGRLEALELGDGRARWGFRGRSGQVWITGAGGLYRAQGERLERVAELDDSTITACQYEDHRGVVWCTGPGGLRRVENGLMQLLRLDVFARGALLALQPGPDASLWIATTAGLYRASISELDDYANGAEAPLMRRFDERHGMRSSEFTRAYSPGIAASGTDGRHWWATMAGVVSVDTARLAVATEPPAARIEGLTVDDVPVVPDLRGQLGPAVGRVAIRYTALSLTDAASLHFRYRLQPGVYGWTETTDREMATYGLAAGDYRFEVQASFDRGHWPESGSQIEFTVLPLWYETWWARGGLLLGVLGLLIGVPLLRIRRLRQHAHTLAVEVAARTRELRTANNQLVWMARTDPLTGIANRRHFDQYLGERLAQPDLPLALLLADVDAFKDYNDRYGHLAGDDCLQRVVQALVAATPDDGALLARFGGEEFVLLLEGAAAELAADLARDMLQAVRALALDHPDAPAGVVTISIGYALRSGPAESADALFRRADQAMYRAKAEGRNCFRGDA